ncbi:MAG: VOC family protein [Burkholderiaceae bacterium]|nr:VOC family protein [Burkholderiaceae bacterium]
MLTRFWINMMVDDIHATIAFYRDVFGFEHIMSVPRGVKATFFEYDPARPLIYAAIRCGGIELMMQQRQSLIEEVPAFAPGAPTGGTLTFYFQTDDVEALAAKVRGVCEVVRDLHDTFYGMREIYVRDLNGYVLCFSQPVQRA